MSQRISIIIPFFQKQNGILRKAIGSIIAQEITVDVSLDIYVVDDASPVPAKLELKDIDLRENMRLFVLEQENQGPGGARNTALDQMDQSTDFVAFLDSDDSWSQDHLNNALNALGNDYDFYFSDFYQLNATTSAFQRAARINVEDHPTINDSNHLHEYKGDLFDQVITGNIIGTPTVVYRYRANPQLRFQKGYMNAGEDYLFWLGFSHSNKRVVFSSKCECTCGEGINIYSGSKWGTSESLNRIKYEIKYRKAIARQFPLNNSQRLSIRQSIESKRQEFAEVLIHRLHHRKSISFNQIVGQIAVDPLSYLQIPVFLFKKATGN